MASKPQNTDASKTGTTPAATQGATGQKAATATKSAGKARAAEPDATSVDAESLLKADHRKVEQLFKDYESAGSTEQKQSLQNRSASS